MQPDYQTKAGAPYLDLFDLPQNAWRASDQARYSSFDYGNVNFVALDSNALLYSSDKAASDDMFDWLRADLEQTEQLWKIVVTHLLVYSTGPHQADSQIAQAKSSPIFETYGVDLVLSGHERIYQRSRLCAMGRSLRSSRAAWCISSRGPDRQPTIAARIPPGLWWPGGCKAMRSG